MEKSITSPAESLVKNQKIISDHKSEIENLIQSVGRNGDLYPSQWIQLITFIYEFRPDFILELGRGYGNSTCAFNEVCQLMKPDRCSVVSLCISHDWDTHTTPNLLKVVPADWFNPLTTLNENILTFDFEKVLKGKKRVVIFWDAHGFDIAEIILGKILPLIEDRDNLVIMHDLSDARYIGDAARFYGENGIWKGKNDWSGPRLQLGHINSCVEQAVAAIDFCSRNKIQLHSADESYYTEINDAQMEGLVNVLGTDFVSRNGHWFWFSLAEAEVELTFPRIMAGTTKKPEEPTTVKKIFSAISSKPIVNQRFFKTNVMDFKGIVSKFNFKPLFHWKGGDLMAHLETNFYDTDKENDAIETYGNEVKINPTTLRDHLATPFFSIIRSSGEDEKFVKVTLNFNTNNLQDIPCSIVLQDNQFNNISANLLVGGSLSAIDKNRITTIVPLDGSTYKIRLVINLNKGKSVVLPELMMIEESS